MLDECIEKLGREGEATNSKSSTVDDSYLGWQRIIARSILRYYRMIRHPSKNGVYKGLVKASNNVTFHLYV